MGYAVAVAFATSNHGLFSPRVDTHGRAWYAVLPLSASVHGRYFR